MFKQNSIIYSKIVHKRYKPKSHRFTYKHYYLALRVSDITEKKIANLISLNKCGLLSFYDKDHTSKTAENNSNLSIVEWLNRILAGKPVSSKIKDIYLITMPRICNHIFNPVSFWMCLDDSNNLIAVICEVNNTFGEGHVYFCSKKDGSKILNDNELVAEKFFHVSPFFKVDGLYKFKFILTEDFVGCFINYVDKDNNRLLTASLSGFYQPLSKLRLYMAFIRYPFITIKTWLMIHWQAWLLYFKGINYYSKPTQKNKKITSNTN